MQHGKWRYGLGRSTGGAVVSLILLALLGGVTFWLYHSGSKAVWFGVLLTVLALVVTLLAVYRSYATKFLVGETGFYHQTRPGNGRFYRYCNLKRAWCSTEQSQTGKKHWCFHYQLPGKPTVRVFCSPADQKALAYLMSRIRAYQEGAEAATPQREPEKYEITGNTLKKPYLAIAMVLWALFLLLELSLLFRTISQRQYPLALLHGLGILVGLGAIVYLAVRNHCFRVTIDDKGFYVRTTPFNGRYYRYTAIQSCKEIRRVYRRRSGSRSYAFYFAFTNQEGITRMFPFRKNQFDREIQVLKTRIQGANRRDVQPPPKAARSGDRSVAQPLPQAAPAAAPAQPRRDAALHTWKRPSPLLLLVVGLALLWVGLYLLSPYLQSVLGLQPRNTIWPETTATVVNVTAQADSYSVRYSYTVDGTTYENNTTWDTLVHLGDTISIAYNPASPQFSKVTEQTEPVTPAGIPVGSSLWGFLLAIAGLLSLIAAALDLRKRATAAL